MRPSWALLAMLACSGGDSKDTSTSADTDTDTDADTDADTDTDTDTDAERIEDLTVVAGPIVHATDLQITVGRDVTLTVDCEADTTGTWPEVHAVGPIEAAASEVATLALSGLLADTNYDCVVTAGDDDGEDTQQVTVVTEPLPESLEGFELSIEEMDTDAIDPGYILVNAFEVATSDYLPPQAVLAFDRDGQVRWYMLIDEGHDGGINAEYRADEGVFYMGGGLHLGIAPTIATPQGEVLVEHADYSTRIHHDIKWIEDSMFLLTWGPGEDSICVEERDAWGDVSIATWCTDDDPDTFASDPSTRANSLVVRDEDTGRKVYVNLSDRQHIFKLDWDSHSIDWNLGPGLDFLGDNGSLSYLLHDLQVVDCETYDLCLLYYDNGIPQQQSKAVMLSMDEVNGFFRVDREWEQSDWYEAHWGGMELLANGNWLIGIGHNETEHPDSHDSQVVEVDPGDNVVWRAHLGPDSTAIYRARFVDACDVFTNTGQCG